MEDIGDIKTPKSSRAKSARVKPAPAPLPPIPERFSRDVERLTANDARLRDDGRISAAVVERDLEKLQRALERFGEDALAEGIEIALGKGLGLAYAAGCARNHGRRAQSQPSLLSPSLPADNAWDDDLPSLDRMPAR